MNINLSAKKLLKAVLSNSYSQAELRDFVQLCYFLALPLVRKRISQGKMNLNLLGLQERDIVYDCIADLFLRSEDGNLPKIRAFLESDGLEVDKSTDERLLAELRRLVFGKVHNNLIRLLGEVDPILGKILRNVRLAIDKSDTFVEMHRFGESYVVSNRVEPLMSLPPIPFNLLEQDFTPFAGAQSDVPSLLRALWEFLSSQVDYQRAVSIVTVGLLFKGVYQRSFDAESEQQPQIETGDSAEKTQDLVHVLCGQLHRDMLATYVMKGKITAEIYEKYFCALEEILMDRVEGAGDGLTYYNYLERQLPKLTKSEYVKKHKKIIEYLVRMSKSQISRRIKDM